MINFREIGIPRCQKCDRLILPWQSWVCEIEGWPQHENCFHGYLVEMLAFVRAEKDGAMTDYYDHCRFCRRTTDSGFMEAAPA